MIFVFDDFELDAERLELRCAGELRKANRTVLLTLACLLRNAGQLVTKDELIDEVWEGRAVADTVITVATARLRKTLGQRRGEREYIENVYGRGYRFVHPVSAREPASRPPPAMVGSGVVEPPFVGRERALERLRQALGRARGGRGSLCALIGEPGIGKTALVEAFEVELRASGTPVSWGFCQELSDTPPLAPIRRVLRRLLSSASEAELERALGAERAVLQGLLQGGAGEAESPVAPPFGGSRARLFDAASRALAFVAERGPQVIVLDDLHRGDLASLELLAQLVDELARTRVLIVATLRPPGPGDDALRDAHLRYAIGPRNCERIALEPLVPADVAIYVGTVLDDRDGALGRAVFDKSEGNPFFMVELSRQLADMEAPSPDALRVPEAALELMRQRIARLDDDSRSVLSAAAVIGRSFELGVLQRVTDSEPAALALKLDAALGAETLVAAPDSATAFAFGHELLRLALYDALPPSERRQLHLRTAHALEDCVEAGETVSAGELAFHYHRALPEGDPRKTVEHSRAAAAAASVVFANAEVVRHMRHALEALELMPHPSARLRMSLLQGIILHTRTTDPAEFDRAMRALIRLASERGDGASLLLAAVMCSPAPGLPPEPSAEQAHARALSLLPAEQPGLRAVAIAGLATLAPHCFDRAVVEERLGEAKALAGEVNTPMVEHAVLLCQLYLHGGPAHDSEADEARAKLEALARAHARMMPVLPGELAYSRAVTASQCGGPGDALEALELAIARYRELDQREGLWHAERGRILLRVERDDEPDAIGELSALHARAELQSLHRTAAFRAFDRVVVLPALGRPAVVDGELRRALGHEASDRPGIWAMKLRAQLAAGWVEDAAAALRAMPVEKLRELPCDRDYLGTLGHLARVACELGALEHARAIHGLLSPYEERICCHVAFHVEGTVPQVLAMLAEALGRSAQAAEHLRAAVALAEQRGLPRRAAEARTRLQDLGERVA